MLRIALGAFSLCLVTLLSAAPTRAQGVVGEWAVDLDALLASPELAKLPPEQRDSATDMARKILAKTRMVVRADGTLTLSMDAKLTRQGTWKAAADGTYAFTVDTDTTAAVLKGDAIELTAGQTTMTFRRIGAAPPPSAAPQPIAKSDPPIDFTGTWRVDLEGTRKLFANDTEVLGRIERDKALLETMQLTFDGGKMTMKAGDGTRGGTYAHRATQGGITTLETREDGAPEHEIEVFTLERQGDRLKVSADKDTLLMMR